MLFQPFFQILNDLLCGPLSESNLHAFLNQIEPMLTEALAADPNNQIEDPIPEFFNNRRALS